MNNKLVGKITITKRDANTMEIVDVVEQSNVITHMMILDEIARSTSTNSDVFNWGATSSSPDITIPSRISLSSRLIQQNNQTSPLFSNGPLYPTDANVFPPRSEFDTSDTIVSAWQLIEGTPPFFELVERFNSPATTRTFNSVFTHNTGNPERPATIVGLNVPCVQNVGEILDITYRIQVFEGTPLQSPDNMFVGSQATRDIYINTRLLRTPSSANPYESRPLWAKQPDPTDPENELLRIPVFNNPSNDTTATGSNGFLNENNNRLAYNFSNFKLDFDSVVSREQFVGSVMRSVSFGGNIASSSVFFRNRVANSNPNAPIAYSQSAIIGEIVPSDFAFKPIQPIQTHSAAAPQWGLDVDFLATGQGSISVDGDSWVQQDWPEFWRVDISKSGEVGTARYFFRNRRLLDFDGETYQGGNVLQYTDLSTVEPDVPDNAETTVKRSHGTGDTARVEPFGADTYFSWNENGINVYFSNDAKVIAYDSTTVPALPATAIKQVVSTQSGDLWVACAETGLYRITDALNKSSAIVTKMTEASNGVFAGSDNACHAVTVGNDNAIFVVFDGSLSKTSNPSDAIPVFEHFNPTSTIPFEYAGLTDNNWSLAKYIRVDRNTDDNQLAVMVREGTAERIVWWSEVGIVTEGPISGTLFDSRYFWRDGNQYGRVDVSRRGNLWAWQPLQGGRFDSLLWGTTLTTPITSSAADNGDLSKPIFFYDYYDNPYIGNQTDNFVAGSSTSTSSVNQIHSGTMIDIDGEHYSHSHWFESSDVNNTRSPSFAFQDARGQGIYSISSVDFHERYIRGDMPKYFYQPTTSATNANYLDSLNGVHSPFEENMWDRYHWNGITWERNFHVDLADTAANAIGPFPAIRNNFDTESHTFNGRAMVDVSSVFENGTFGSTADATFVFSLQPTPKDDSTLNGTYHIQRAKKTSPPITVFDVSDVNRQCKFMWKDNTANSQIVFVEDGVSTIIAGTPASLTNTFYRLVVSIAGNQLTAYLDGIQLGNAVTLSQAYDWSNASSDLLAFIGSRVYGWDNTLRHAPNQSDFFKGTMRNVQIWNTAWDATDVANDFADIDGVITSKAATNLIARYEFTESLEGLETKITHATKEPLADGVSISFANGLNPTAFIATDYYTFGVVDGILKDNSLSFSREHSIYAKPIDANFSEFTNEAGTNTVQSTSNGTQITEPASFGNESIRLPNPIAQASVTLPHGIIADYQGKLSRSVAGSINSSLTLSQMHGATVSQYIETDGYFEFTPAFGDNYIIAGFIENNATQPNSSGNTNQSQYTHAFNLEPNGDISIRESGTLVAINVSTYAFGERLKIQRAANVVTYSKIDLGGVETVLYTSLVSSVGRIYVQVTFPFQGNGIVDAIINYTYLENTMRIGNANTGTGSFDPDWIRCDESTATVELFLDGVPALVTIGTNNNVLDLGPVPVGEVFIAPRSGHLIFNPADAGRVVTGRVTAIFDA